MKIRTFLICLLAFCFMTESAFAEISASSDAANSSVAVTAAVSGEEIQILLLKPGYGISDAETAAASSDKSELGNVVEYFGQATAKDNKLETAIPMRADAAKGKYLLVIDGEETSFYFAPYDELLDNMIPEAKAALSNGTFGEFAEGNGKYFCNSDMYENLSSGKTAAKYASDMMSGYNEADKLKYMSKLTSAMNMGIIMEALNENKITDFTVAASMTDTDGMTVPIEKIDLIDQDVVKNVLSDISGKNYSSAAAYKNRLSESIFLNVLCNGADMTNAEKKAFFEAYAEKLGMDLSNYYKLSDNKKSEVIAKLSAENTSSTALLQTSLDKLCKNALPTTTTGGGAGGGGGSSGGGGGGSGSTRAIYGNDTINTQTSGSDTTDNTPGGFTDLSECKWAQPAIEYLTKINMIKGYDDNTFKPFKNISRAEFISILARKYLPNESYPQSFSDVETGSWYFDYIENAFNNGIIKGKDNDIFAPDANISRQDIAVILFRLAGFIGREISGTAAEFADDPDIASYAKDAVYALKSAGIINGYENGKFNPNASATRAEAAQMIYNFILFLE